MSDLRSSALRSSLPASRSIRKLDWPTSLSVIERRLDAIDARFAALDRLLKSMTDVMDGLVATDTALMDAVKALGERIEEAARLAESL